MTERLLTVKLTYDELRLLSDSFSTSFIHDGVDPDTAKLEEIGEKLSAVMIRAKGKP